MSGGEEGGGRVEIYISFLIVDDLRLLQVPMPWHTTSRPSSSALPRPPHPLLLREASSVAVSVVWNSPSGPCHGPSWSNGSSLRVDSFCLTAALFLCRLSQYQEQRMMQHAAAISSARCNRNSFFGTSNGKFSLGHPSHPCLQENVPGHRYIMWIMRYATSHRL